MAHKLTDQRGTDAQGCKLGALGLPSARRLASTVFACLFVDESRTFHRKIQLISLKALEDQAVLSSHSHLATIGWDRDSHCLYPRHDLCSHLVDLCFLPSPQGYLSGTLGPHSPKSFQTPLNALLASHLLVLEFFLLLVFKNQVLIMALPHIRTFTSCLKVSFKLPQAWNSRHSGVWCHSKPESWAGSL